MFANILDILSNMRIRDVIDILIVAFVVYKIVTLVKETRAENIIKGMLLLLFVTELSGILELHTVHWILEKTMNIGVIAAIVVFQPEMRKALEYIGRFKVLKGQFHLNDDEYNKIINILIETTSFLSKDRVGGLIVIENKVGLNEVSDTGVNINGDLSVNLLLNIFYPNSPLHDGALIIKNDKIRAAGCFLPLTQDNTLNKTLGTRHRAGIGVTEVSDSLVIIVSEETGTISLAEKGKLKRNVKNEELKERLLKIYLS